MISGRCNMHILEQTCIRKKAKYREELLKISFNYIYTDNADTCLNAYGRKTDESTDQIAASLSTQIKQICRMHLLAAAISLIICSSTIRILENTELSIFEFSIICICIIFMSVLSCTGFMAYSYYKMICEMDIEAMNLEMMFSVDIEYSDSSRDEEM